MKLATCLLACLFVMLIWPAGLLAAGSQPMIFAGGTVLNLQPKQAGMASGYCGNPAEQAPRAGQQYGTFVSGNAMVTGGGRQMSLQAAIDDGLVSVQGHRLTYDEFIAQLGFGRNDADPEVTRLLRAMYREAAAEGNHTGLDFVNLAAFPLTIEFRETSVLAAGSGSNSGAELATADYLKLLRPSRNAAEHAAMQKAFWRARHDSQLTSLGYRIDGPDRAAELARFRNDFGVRGGSALSTSHAIDRSLLMQSLRPADATVARLAGVRIEHPRLGHDTLYSVFDDAGRLVLSTDDPSRVAAKLRELGGETADTFVDAEGFTADEQVALEASLRAQGGRPIKLVARGRGDYPHDFFTRGATKLLDAEPQIYEAGDAAPLPYRMDVHFQAQGKDVNLTFLGKTKQVLKNAFNRIKARFGPKEVTEMSVCELVANCRKDLRDLHKVDNADLQVLLNGTLGRTQTVAVPVTQRRRAA